MPFKILDADFDKSSFTPIILDGAVMGTFLSLESGPSGLNPEPYITLRDKVVVAVDANITKSFAPCWLLMFQIGGSAVAVPIAMVVVENLEDFLEDLVKLFTWPEVTINTERKLYLETDTSEPIGVQTSTTKIASSMLNIYAVRSGDFEGTWADQFRDQPPDDIITPLDTLPDDPRDKKL